MLNNKPTVSYRLMKPGEEPQVIDLVIDVFSECVAPHYSQEGIEEFRRFANADALAERLLSGNFVLIAEAGRGIIGIIELRENTHVAMFFVGKSHQRQGIGRTLLRKSIAICTEREPTLKRMTVNSSPNAFPAYRQIGFKAVEDEQIVNGIRFIPMALIFDQRQTSCPGVDGNQ